MRLWPVLALAALALPAAGCPGGKTPPDDGDRDNDVAGAACKEGETGGPRGLVEDRTVYDGDAAEVVEMSLTVSDLSGLAAVDDDVAGATVAARVSAADLDTGEGESALLELRGRTARLANQMSYKVHLDPDGPLWRGQQEINLNKHPYDLARIRSHLALALHRAIPHMTSLRTQLVHLTINGDDLGLFTHVEEPDEYFLASHGLDPDGTLYKAEAFSFAPIDAATAADPAVLGGIVDAKANPDLDKLRRMIDDVNDRAIDINLVIASHFDRRNYLTWLATSLLIGQFDNNTTNFFLYSPSTCASWYFLPWDLDGALGYHEQPGAFARLRWQVGPGNWWLSTLHQRFLADPRNVDDLLARVDELRDGPLADRPIADVLAASRDQVAAYALVPPDSFYLPIVSGQGTPAAQWEAEYDRLAEVVGDAVTELAEVLEWPVPVILYQVSDEGDTLLFQWSLSYDFQDDGITYDFDLSETPDFSDVLIERHGGRLAWTEISRPASGTYFWRVISRDDADPEGHFQLPFIVSQAVVVE